MPEGRVLCVNRLCVCASVDADEIKRLGKRFKKLDLDNSGSLSVEEFMSLPELQQNPLVQRVIDIFDTDGNGEVDFKGERAGPRLLFLETARASAGVFSVFQSSLKASPSSASKATKSRSYAVSVRRRAASG